MQPSQIKIQVKIDAEIDDIEEIIEKYPAPIEMIHMLYDKAMENGGHDNISIVYIKLEDNK